jgi:3-methylcrotonyl-CoA carboxylase alpha subunit
VKPLFRKILIANRGEIAVRIARTCGAMGIPTVAAYSDADQGEPHVRAADEAVRIGAPEASGSYLAIDRILAAARSVGADALHPGYGFLSQNGDFADAVASAGMTFIGPPGRVHRLMGDKKGARRLMAAAGVPVLPGYDGDDQSEETLLARATAIGWPLIVKPSRGGGGKGLRVVERQEDFVPFLRASRREAKAAFGDDAVVLERFVLRPRHVEVQVLGDSAGTLLHLFERECSIQRRHQKVVEESPSPALDGTTRQALCEAGVAAARAAGYVNAGTVEFLLDPKGSFYFLEMNTRLQVEHAVTEMTTGLDLVRHQIEIAAGGAIPFAQADVLARGHSLECRVYAEDPFKEDLPSSGRVLLLAAPEGPGVRFDCGVATGSEVTVHYDPLLAKVITWGRERAESIERMEVALQSTALLGVATNLSRLLGILGHEAFRKGKLHTGFLEEHFRDKAREPPPSLAFALVAAAQQLVGRRKEGAGGAPLRDPWDEVGPWRLS